MNEEVAQKLANVATYAGGTTATIFGLTPGEWSVIGVIGGLVIGLAGYFTGLYFKRQHLKLARANSRMGEAD